MVEEPHPYRAPGRGPRRGPTNREIGDRPFILLGTVQAHLEDIFARPAITIEPSRPRLLREARPEQRRINQ